MFRLPKVSGIAALSLALPAFALLSGCADPGSVTVGGPTAGLAPGGATSMYVLQIGPSSPTVLTFVAGANGNVAPNSSLALPSGFQPFAFTTDSAGNFYIGGSLTSGGTEALVYAAGASGAATPIRTVVFAATGVLPFPMALAVDTAGNLYAAFKDSVAVYDPTASGLATPTRTLSGALTQLSAGTNIAITLDSAANLYVSSENGTSGSILVFPNTANGNVAPTRTITSQSGYQFYGVAVDGTGNVFAAEVYTTSPASTPSSKIVEYAPGASGAATPLKTVTFVSAPNEIDDIRLDSAGNLYAGEEWVPTAVVAPKMYGVAVIGPSVSGNVSPNAEEIFNPIIEMQGLAVH